MPSVLEHAPKQCIHCDNDTHVLEYYPDGNNLDEYLFQVTCPVCHMCGPARAKRSVAITQWNEMADVHELHKLKQHTDAVNDNKPSARRRST